VLPLLLLALAPSLGTSPSQEPATDRGHGVAVQPAVASAGYGRRHALVVGIDEYGDTGFPNLGYAVADARAVAKVLIERYGFEQENVRLLLDDDATHDALSSALEDWACDLDRVGEEDLFVLFFAGHGETRTLGKRGARGYLVPADGERGSWSTLLSMDDLEATSESLPAKHALFLLDCCFGGLAVSRSAPPLAAGLTNRARQAISAGTAEQTVQDGGGGGHSVFTGALLAGLGGDADVDGDQVVTFGELFNHVGRLVERKTERRQTPLQAAFPDHEGGNVALFPPGVKPGQMTAAERLRQLQQSEKEQLAELNRLSDALLVLGLIEEADELWPPHPDRIARYRDWLARAGELLDRKHRHEASVRQVSQEAYLSQVVAGQLEEGEGAEPDWAKVDEKLRWRHETFVELVASLDDLSAGLLAEEQVTEEHGWSVPKRLRFAEWLAAGFAPGGEHARRWDDARAAIDAAYFELNMVPQMGLVPIGPDPYSGLWEFAHLMTGEPAERDAAGELELSEQTGLVLVLVPGEAFWMGAQWGNSGWRNFDPQARMDELPVHQVELSTHFLSKYEMTQGQWKRLTGRNPSYFQGPELEASWQRHPVEHVSWLDCMEWLPRAGLSLPSEAQWENGTRGGTQSPWWTGEERESLRRRHAANLADQAAGRTGVTWKDIDDWPELDDGFARHAPVGTYAANALGLHEVAGNLWEWCLDGYDSGFYDRSPLRDPVAPYAGNAIRVLRGGSYISAAVYTRSALRDYDPPSFADKDLGVRPARALTE
jgi:formylglycine-generating enzyme required for sulfatase activity